MKGALNDTRALILINSFKVGLLTSIEELFESKAVANSFFRSCTFNMCYIKDALA